MITDFIPDFWLYCITAIKWMAPPFIIITWLKDHRKNHAARQRRHDRRVRCPRPQKEST